MTRANPQTRQDFDVATLLRDVESLEQVFKQWGSDRQGAIRAYRASIEDLHREAIRRLIAEVKQDPAGFARLREALADEVVYAVLRHLGIVKASLQERVEDALDSVRPMLASHGGDVELVGVEAPDSVKVRFLGACDGCPASQLTFIAGVKQAIQERCPGIENIEEVRGLAHAPAADKDKLVRFVSPFALGVEGDWLQAAALDDIPEGGVLQREIRGQDLLLSRNGAVVSAFQNACAHLGMPLDGGEAADGVLTCPHHGFRYLLESGECLTAPEVQLEPHAVRVIGNRVEVRLNQ